VANKEDCGSTLFIIGKISLLSQRLKKRPNKASNPLIFLGAMVYLKFKSMQV
jgi:hypothetical protein